MIDSDRYSWTEIDRGRHTAQSIMKMHRDIVKTMTDLCSWMWNEKNRSMCIVWEDATDMGFEEIHGWLYVSPLLFSPVHTY